MKKRVIFDVDETIMQDVNYYSIVKKLLAMQGHNFTHEQLKKYLLAMKKYEQQYASYQIDEYLNYLRCECGINFTDKYMDMFLQEVSKYDDALVSLEKRETLEYLKERYELIALSSFFKAITEKRLKNIGVLSYFSEVYGGDEAIKPSEKAYLDAIGYYDIHDCILIEGKKDEYKSQNIGIDSIILDEDSKTIGNNRVRDIIELKKVL